MNNIVQAALVKSIIDGYKIRNNVLQHCGESTASKIRRCNNTLNKLTYVL